MSFCKSGLLAFTADCEPVKDEDLGQQGSRERDADHGNTGVLKAAQ